MYEQNFFAIKTPAKLISTNKARNMLSTSLVHHLLLRMCRKKVGSVSVLKKKLTIQNFQLRSVNSL